MIKVVIADEEQRVCDLFRCLVYQNAFDMKIVGMAHTSEECIEIIRMQKPQLLITEIFMPGYDGLEVIRQAKEMDEAICCIIISRYRRFEYAKLAIQYEVRDYILKPVKEKEVLNALQKIQEEYVQKERKLKKEREALMTLKHDERRIRRSFLSEILHSSQKLAALEESQMANEQYHYRFQDGYFQISVIRIDDVGEEYNRNRSCFIEKIRFLLLEYMDRLCFEWEFYFENNRAYCLLNYQKEKHDDICRQWEKILNSLNTQEKIFGKVKVTIGMGKSVESLKQIQKSKKTALYAEKQRIFSGIGKVLAGEEIRLCGVQDDQIFDAFNKRFSLALDHMNQDEIRSLILELKRELLGRGDMTGYELIQMAKEVANQYQLFLKNIGIKEKTSFFEKFVAYADNCYSVDGLFARLVKGIQDSLKIAVEEKKQKDSYPIHLAKEYIGQNYAKQVSLTEISELVGFNATYFSRLFRKETGQTFIEYLVSVRMGHAKEMLRETRISVAEVCSKVGYSDVKYFTKNFIKYVGLKPKEYRKLYS